MIGHTIERDGELYTVVDKCTLGNNPPRYYYILVKGEKREMFVMGVWDDKFSKINHWRLQP